MTEQIDDLTRAELALGALATDPEVQIRVERADGSQRSWALAGPAVLAYGEARDDETPAVTGAAPRAAAAALIAGDLGLPPRLQAEDVRVQVPVDPALRVIALLSGPGAPVDDAQRDRALAECLAELPAPALDWLTGVRAAATITITASSPLRTTDLAIAWSDAHTTVVAVGVGEGEPPIAVAALLDDERLHALLAALLEG